MTQTMKKRCRNMLLALMVSIGMMGAVSVQAQTSIEDSGIIVTVHPNTTGQYKFLIGVKDTAFGICERVAEFQTANDLVYKAFKTQITNVNTISSSSLGFKKMGWLGCRKKYYRITDPEKVYTESGAYGTVWVLWGEIECQEDEVRDPVTEACVPEKQCLGDLVKDQNGNCTCPEGEERVRLWGDNQCEPKCPEGQERNLDGECECSAGFEPFVPAGARTTGVVKPLICLPKCDTGKVRDELTGFCVCPAGTVSIGDQCIPKPDIEENPAECRDTNVARGNERGGLVCDKPGGKMIGTCTWEENFGANNDKAKAYIGACVTKHEQWHYTKADMFCNDGRRGDFTKPEDKKTQECDGHIAELMCLERQKPEDVCRGDENPAQCKAEIQSTINGNIASMQIQCKTILSFNSYSSGHPDNPSQPWCEVTRSYKGVNLSYSKLPELWGVECPPVQP